ncbi:hypothetical protein DOZ58_04080 [Acetobacterium sp. KB-1]|nr:hypothetical protein DOZ58_04080 [Acetobacterium sp. KB-1]
MDDLKSGLYETLRISASYLVIDKYLPKITSSFKKNHPNIKIEYYPKLPGEAISEVVHMKSDICLTFSIDKNCSDLPKGIKYKLLCKEKIYLRMLKKHPLAEKPYLTYKDLNKSKLIVLGVRAAFRSMTYSRRRAHPVPLLLQKNPMQS